MCALADTEIGERGINLSGGQKVGHAMANNAVYSGFSPAPASPLQARVSMARALYRANQSDIYLLDGVSHSLRFAGLFEGTFLG